MKLQPDPRRAPPATTTFALVPLIAALALLGGCGSDARPTKTDTADADVVDGTDVGAGVDGSDSVDATAFDAGPPSERGTYATPLPKIVKTGTGNLLLRGVVLAPDGVLDPGEVLVVGNQIACVAVDCSDASGADTATVVETHATISPGLVDCHNHMSYNFLGEWVPDPPQFFNNRYEWADDPGYEAHIEPYAANRSKSTHFCPASKWAELRSLIHGTTTMQGQPSAASSCIDGWVRNANRYHGLGYDHMRGTISSPREFTDAQAANMVESFEDPIEPTTRYHVHMCEGVSGNNIEEEFDSFAGRDPRKNRHNGTSLLAWGTAMLIHGVALTAAQLDEALDENAVLVWSPSSNFALYGPGKTAPIADILARGILTGIGPDWTVSGADEMLTELRVCLDYGKTEQIAALTTKKLWQMATEDGAAVLGLNGPIGQLVVGARADIAVFGRSAADPYLTVIDAQARDVRLVLIDGKVYYGDSALQSLGRNAHCEPLDACGASKFICVSDGPGASGRDGETMVEIHDQLFDLLEGTGTEPYVEKYGRGSELLGLVGCDAGK
ncbi:MAG: amidohydrolase family protein [Deltaproteobacteria bacterium]|nr:amidohydrolase family protein [Deltaproteobacteria bacterium]